MRVTCSSIAGYVHKSLTYEKSIIAISDCCSIPYCGAPDKPCGVGRADANPKLLLNDT